MLRESKNFKDKPAFGIYLFTEPALIIQDLELIKDVTTRSFDHFHERGIYVNEQGDPLWHNIFSSGGQYWKDLRARLSPTFTSGRMKMMFPIVSEIADRMVNYIILTDGFDQNIEMKDVFVSYGTEVIANVAFGLDFRCFGNPNNEFSSIAKATAY